MVSLELEARLDNLLATAQEETADIDMFAPIPEKEECPICLLPLPLLKVVFKFCCGKNICQGCVYKHLVTDARKGVNLEKYKCPFCQQLATSTSKNEIKCLKKLMKKNSPDAYMMMARNYESGDCVFQSDTKALEMYIRAAELGNADAFEAIGSYYQDGTAVEQNMSNALEYYEVAAKKGSILAHNYLAKFHLKNGNTQKSIDHFKVLASAGYQQAMDYLMEIYKEKLLSKEELTQTLRSFQASIDKMKSKDRDNARLLEEAQEKGDAPPAQLLSDYGLLS